MNAGAIINFNNVPSITLQNGAQGNHIYWVAGSAITFTGTVPPYIPGVLIAQSSINFANGSTVNGRLYAQTAAITFSGTFAVNGDFPTPPPEPVVCYAEGTLLQTTRGLIPIERIRVGQELVSKGELSKR